MCDFYSELPGLKNDRIQGKEKVKPGKERASESCLDICRGFIISIS